MTKRFYISSVEAKKSGVNSKGKPWTLYNVIDQEGKKYSTFAGVYMAMVGQEVEREIKEEQYTGKDGNQHTSYSLIEPGLSPRPQAQFNPGPMNPQGTTINDRFLAIEKRLDALEAKKADPAGEFTSPDADPIDLPF